MKNFLFFILIIAANKVFAIDLVCTTEVRHFCKDFDQCKRNVDENKTIYKIKKTKNELSVVKTIAGAKTAEWKSKLLHKNSIYNTGDTYGEEGAGNLTTITINSLNSRFLLSFTNANDEMAWSQVEIGTCK